MPVIINTNVRSTLSNENLGGAEMAQIKEIGSATWTQTSHDSSGSDYVFIAKGDTLADVNISTMTAFAGISDSRVNINTNGVGSTIGTTVRIYDITAAYNGDGFIVSFKYSGCAGWSSALNRFVYRPENVAFKVYIAYN